MKIRRFYGKDMREALKQVKDELGGDAVIMSNKKLADGIEIVAAYDKEPAIKPSVARNTVKTPSHTKGKTPTLSEIIGDSGPDSLKALLDKQAKQSDMQQANKPVAEKYAPAKQSQRSSTPIDNRAINELREELSSLRNVLQFHQCLFHFVYQY